MKKLWLLLYPVAVPFEAVLNKAKTGKWNWKKAHQTIMNGVK